MRVKLLRVESEKPNLSESEEIINREIKKLEAKKHRIIDVKISVVRDAAPEFKIKKAYAFTVMILYE